MRTRVGVWLAGLAVGMPLMIRADADDRGGGDDRACRESEHHEHNVNTPERLLGVIPVPGNPIMSTDIGWVDPSTERFYLADGSNFGVDIVNADDHFYVGRVAGMAGPKPSGGATFGVGALMGPSYRLSSPVLRTGRSSNDSQIETILA